MQRDNGGFALWDENGAGHGNGLRDEFPHFARASGDIAQRPAGGR